MVVFESLEGEYVAPYVADFDVCNCGTIPVKVWVANIVIALSGGNDHIEYGVMAITEDGEIVDPYAYQLEPDDCLHIVIWIVLDEADRGYSASPDAPNMGVTGTITGSIEVMQWNEEP
jgi:hypothetical protein